MKIRTRIALSTAIIVAISLSGASGFIYWNVWREDQGGNFERSTQTLLIGLIGLVLIGSVLSFFFAGYLSRRALKPVQRLIYEVEQATEATRIHVDNPADDIGKIALSLNGLLDRIEASSLNQKSFTADAGHELRGPLTTMQLSIDALRAAEDSIELKDISEEVGRLAKLCNDLLDLSRVDGREIKLNAHSLLEIVDEQMRTFSGKKSTIRIEIDPSIDCIVSCNRQLFGMAVRNLIENAFDFAKTTISISAHRNTDGVHLVIKDDGPGVQANENEKIFDRFYRTEKVRTIGKGGTGLGLSVASAVMVAHRGKAFSTLSTSGGEFHLVLI